MKKVYCRTTGKGQQSFYLQTNGKTYFLFTQDYRKSNKEYFQNGVFVDDRISYFGVHSAAVQKTLDKLLMYFKYIENEYQISVLKKSKDNKYKKNKLHKERFNWREYNWEIA